ncbi:alanine racemase [Candidatus Kaiserbacteria bacterium]|nr:alanine racemase [Candidatus Kaiserbacteria bacterium]
MLKSLLKKIRSKKKYERLIKVVIDSAAIKHNLSVFQTQYNVAVAPVLKSNAYGHGLVEIGNIVDTEEIPFICVDTFFEALTLRSSGIQKPILIIGYTPHETIVHNKLRNTSFAVISLEELKRLATSKKPASIHLKIDTGMHRHGVHVEELHEALNLIAHSSLILEGVYTHLADADTKGSTLTDTQIDAWNTAVQTIRSHIPTVTYFHCGHSAGSFYSKHIDANGIRLGIGLYGVNVGLDDLDLKPALEMKTRITSIKTLKQGETIGYNGTFTAEKDMRVATIPVGYNEGLDRRLSNKGSVLVHGTVCPILGRVNMNITSIDVSQIPDIKLDDEVTIISGDKTQPNSIEHLAKLCETIPYELLVHIQSTLYRKVI